MNEDVFDKFDAEIFADKEAQEPHPFNEDLNSFIESLSTRNPEKVGELLRLFNEGLKKCEDDPIKYFEVLLEKSSSLENYLISQHIVMREVSRPIESNDSLQREERLVAKYQSGQGKVESDYNKYLLKVPQAHLESLCISDHHSRSLPEATEFPTRLLQEIRFQILGLPLLQTPKRSTDGSNNRDASGMHLFQMPSNSL